MYKPACIAFDYESTSLNFWTNDFKVLSCSFSWRDVSGGLKSRVTFGESETRQFLARIVQENIPLACHNASFEYGVTHFKFPEAKHLIKYDTMRLVQLYDHGGPNSRDYSLEKCITRILPDLPNHKQAAYKFLKDNGFATYELSMLPKDLLTQYNQGDSEATLKLYETITKYFETIAYDWSLDHYLYMSTARHIALAKARGIAVDRVKLAEYRDMIILDIHNLDSQFKAEFKTQIEAIEAGNHHAKALALKTDKGRIKSLLRPVKPFNLKSSKDLEALFVSQLGLSSPFKTPKGKPSFKSAHMGSWGIPGKMLENRNKKLLILQQVESLLSLSVYDSRWHHDLKAVGTQTGRNSGGYGG